MKLVAILALIAASFLTVLPASAASQSCATSGHDKPNHMSGLSSTSQGGRTTCSDDNS